MRIFISYSSQDQAILDGFSDRVLKLGLKIKDEQIDCTGIEGSSVRSGEQFKDWIAEKIRNCDVVILLISRNYKASEVCMNELGAIWMCSDKVIIPFIIDPLGYESAGFIHNTSQLLRLSKKSDLLKFRDDHPILYKAETFNAENYNRQIEEFLKVFESPSVEALRPNRPIPSKEIFDNYFNRFFAKGANTQRLLLEAQPTLSDCRAVFTEQFADQLYMAFTAEFSIMMDANRGLSDDDSLLKEYKYEVSNYDDLVKHHIDDIGRKEVSNVLSALQRNPNYYSVRFLREGDQWGIATQIWCYINGRWVFFPKPNEQINGIVTLRENKYWKRLIKIARWFGLPRIVAESGGGLEALLAFLIHEMKRK